MTVREFIEDIEKTCKSCKYWNDDTGYCDDCSFTESKWEDAHEEDPHEH